MKPGLMRYLIGTSDEMLGVPEIMANSKEYDKAIKESDFETARRISGELVDTVMGDNFVREFYGTVGYVALSIPLAVALPSVGVPLAADSLTRVLRMTGRGTCPVGIIGSAREIYQYLRR
jgi:hypothetical protein